MKIILAFDDDYAPHAATVIESILAHTDQKLSFALLYRKLDPTILNTFRQHFEHRVASIEFIKIEPALLQEVVHTKIASHLTLDIYLRLFAPLVLPNDDYAIYLDSDIIVLDDISKILDNVDFSKAVYAVTESDPNYKLKGWAQILPIERPIAPYISMEAYLYRLRHYLGMSQEAKFFNTGVLILNLKMWREQQLTHRVIEYIAQKTMLNNSDQDALNAILNGDYGELEPRWNNGVLMFGLMSGHAPSLLYQARNQPSIVHFLGVKPWRYLCAHPQRKTYLKYRKLTPWPTNIYHDKNLKNILIKYISRPLHSCMHALSSICPTSIKQRFYTPKPGFFDLTYLQK